MFSLGTHFCCLHFAIMPLISNKNFELSESNWSNSTITIKWTNANLKITIIARNSHSVIMIKFPIGYSLLVDTVCQNCGLRSFEIVLKKKCGPVKLSELTGAQPPLVYPGCLPAGYWPPTEASVTHRSGSLCYAPARCRLAPVPSFFHCWQTCRECPCLWGEDSRS